jgi:ubiquinone/menaquinone biosynthesis C-methylase UbiE
MNSNRSGFDWLARWYRVLEFTAFGRDLERARFEFLGCLSGCSDVLLLGEGDGRCASRLADLAPDARILCVDSSPGMIARASRRIPANAAGRVSFVCADALSFTPEPGRFDAVATLFFLDCFDAHGVASIVGRMGPALRPGAPWLYADFSVPDGGIARMRARAWLAVLYFFFRRGTGLRASSLPPSEETLGRAGWSRTHCRAFQAGMIRSAVFRRPADPVPTGAP